MERVILIKYGELTTKKGNRNFFVKTLFNNIKNKLVNTNIDAVINKTISRMEIHFKEEDLKAIEDIINHTFGIHKYHLAYKVETNLEVIKSTCLEIMKEIGFNTFKIETKRSYKEFVMDSMELNQELGGIILKNISNIKVDVHNPEVLLTVEISRYDSFIYTNSYQGLGGYPVGVQGKGLVMLSGGIDSPVASFLALKRGIKIDAVYFEAIPHTSLEARNKVIALVKKLTKYTSKIDLIIVPFTKIQETIYKSGNKDYVITIMRRMMYRITSLLCLKRKNLVIINGESIGQVASQTLTSMMVINSVTNIPIIRPVACMDKLEIIDIARKIDTYETSILPYEDCCTVFVPKHPVINPKLDECLLIEKENDYDALINEAISNINVVSISDKDEIEELL